MKFCAEHWEELKQAIKDRGLYHLVHASGEAVVDATARQLEGTDTPQDFDPLMASTMAMYGNALKLGGLYLMGTDEHGNQYCPLCELKKHVDADAVKVWVNECADAQLEYARELGLVPRPA